VTTTQSHGSARAFVLLVALVACLFTGCGKKEAGGGAPGGGGGKRNMTFPVEVAPIASERVEYTVSAVGTVDAYERVQVTARVAGVVEKVRFSEGDAVKKGQVLIEIDPARYTLAARRAQATLERAQASAAEAQQSLDRRKGPEGEGIFSKEEIETWQTRSRTAVAQVSEAKAALDEANLNLRDAYVRAPIEGKMQTRTVQTGQFVQPGTVLGTVLRRDPLLLRFQVPEADAPRLQTGMPVRFRVGSEDRSFSGKITLVSEAADETNRMVPIVAQVDDEHKELLRPGAFADVTVAVGVSEGASVIPQTAIRPSERGFLAFVVKDGVASERVLTLGMRTADGRVEVRKGIAAGEMLVVRGAEPLRDGMQVRVVPPGGVGGPPKEGAGAPDAGAPDAVAPSQGSGPPAKGGSAP
jgi:membrane fusion protein (multidrug efflux system)/multidrug efflux system membrane fusion protein